MKVLGLGALLVPAMLLLAGCSDTGLDPITIAEAAPALLLVDSQEGGRLVSSETRFGLTMPDVAFATRILVDLHTEGAVTIQVRYEDVEFEQDDQMKEAMENVRIRIDCRTDTIVLRTEGMEGFGSEDMDVETTNDAATCSPRDPATVESFMQSILRLFGDLEDMQGLDQAFDMSPPEHTLIAAERDGSDVLAEYRLELEEETTLEVDAVIRGGRIVSEVGEHSSNDVRLDYSTSYAYGTRSPPPDVSGAQRV